MFFGQLRAGGKLLQQRAEKGAYLFRQGLNVEILWKLLGNEGTKKMGECFVREMIVPREGIRCRIFFPREPLAVIYAVGLCHPQRVRSCDLCLAGFVDLIFSLFAKI